MNLRTACLLASVQIFFVFTNAAMSATSPSSRVAKESRSEASEAANDAKKSTQKAAELTKLALEATAKDDAQKLEVDFKAASAKAHEAAKRAEVSTGIAYRKALAVNREFALRASQEAKNALTATALAVKASEEYASAKARADAKAVKSFAVESRHALEKAATATVATFEAATKSFEAVIRKTENYSVAEKARIQERYRRDVAQVDLDIAKLKTELAAKDENAKAGFTKTIDTLERDRDAVSAKVDRLADADSAALYDLRIGVDNAMSDIKASFRKASADMKKEESSAE